MITRTAVKKKKRTVKKAVAKPKKKVKKPVPTAKSNLYAELAMQLRSLLEG